MKRIAIQGIQGAYHEIAARKFFKGEDLTIVPCVTFKELFQKMAQDPELLGIVAIENTIAGSLLPNHDLVRKSGTAIIGEQKVRIAHSLAALPGQSIEDIKEIHSHPMALMQSEEFIDSYTHWKAVESDDTAMAAKEIMDNQIKGRAAVCSQLAAKTYQLEVLASSIETNKLNYTRFLIVANPAKAEILLKDVVVNKASMVFTLPHEEGSLAKILAILSFYRINLTKIQSLPILGRAWEYQFYINLTFDDYDRYMQALDAVRPLLKDFQLLGEYVEGAMPNGEEI